MRRAANAASARTARSVARGCRLTASLRLVAAAPAWLPRGFAASADAFAPQTASCPIALQRSKTVRDDLARSLAADLEWDRLEAEVQRIKREFSVLRGGGAAPVRVPAGGDFQRPQQQPAAAGAGSVESFAARRRAAASEESFAAGNTHARRDFPRGDGGGWSERASPAPTPAPQHVVRTPVLSAAEVAAARKAAAARAQQPRRKPQHQRDIDRLLALVAAYAPAACALLGVLICLFLKFSGRIGAASRPVPSFASAPPSAVSQFAADARAALADVAAGLRDGAWALVASPAALLSRARGGGALKSATTYDEDEAYAEWYYAQLDAAEAEVALQQPRLSPAEERAARSAAFAAARCGTPAADTAACAALLDSAPLVSAAARAGQTPRPGSLQQKASATAATAAPRDAAAKEADRARRAVAWRDSRCGTPQADAAACAALLSLGAAAAARASHAGLDAVAVAVEDARRAAAAKQAQTPRGAASPAPSASAPAPAAMAPAKAGAKSGAAAPPGGAVALLRAETSAGACSLALAASESRTAELMASQTRLERALDALASARASCERGSDTSCAATAARRDAEAAAETARLEALTASAEAAAQRAYTLCMTHMERQQLKASRAAAVVDWLSAEAATLLQHAAALEEQRAAAAARAVAAGAPGGDASEEASWRALAVELEQEALATSAAAAQAADEAGGVAKAAQQAQQARSGAGSGGSDSPWFGRRSSSDDADGASSMAYTMSALAAPLTGVALLSARAAEQLRARLRHRQRKLRGGGGSSDALGDADDDAGASYASAAWVQLLGEARVGGVLTAQVAMDEAVEFEFVWSRVFRGLFEVIPDAHAPWYRITADDLGSRVAVTVTSIVAGGEYGATCSSRTRTIRE
jgi:hypothetical protein